MSPLSVPEAPNDKLHWMTERAVVEFVEKAETLLELSSQAIDDEDGRFSRLIDLALSDGEFDDEQSDEFHKLLGEAGQWYRDYVAAMERGEYTFRPDRLPVKDRHVAEVFNRFHYRSMRKVVAPNRANLIRSSLLTVLVSSFEQLISVLARELMLLEPSLIKGDDSSISFGQLSRFRSIEQAREHIVDKKVDDLLRGEFAQWSSWFSRKEISLQIEDFMDNPERVQEVFARRNVIVHNDRRINRQYLLKVGSQDFDRLGDRLEVSHDYLSDAIQEFAAVGLLLVSSIWMKFTKVGPEHTAAWLDDQLDVLRDVSLHRAVLKVATVVLEKSRGRLPRNYELSLKVSRWVSLRQLSQNEVALKEVKAWDVTGLDLYFCHLKTVLEGDLTCMLKTGRQLIREERLSIFTLRADPAYEPHRESSEYRELLRAVRSIAAAKRVLAQPISPEDRKKAAAIAAAAAMEAAAAMDAGAPQAE
ncbi:hypothetical protein [Cryptosporangium sp. NPDC051539]|uniref:hypothetical protein n=1 Tax=Cryptosporangium sp. NPDC051539 TaxID=3363962 RepID=UPI0037A9D431